MTSNWLPQQPWMNVIPQPKKNDSSLAQGIGALGTALVNRGGDEPENPGAPDPDDQQMIDSPLRKKKTGILSLLGGSPYGDEMA